MIFTFKFVDKKSTYIKYRTITGGTSWRKEQVIVSLTERVSVSLKEVVGAQFRLAVGAHKVFRVPDTPQGGDHLII